MMIFVVKGTVTIREKKGVTYMSYKAIVVNHITGEEKDLGSFPTSTEALEVATKECNEEPSYRRCFYEPIARLER